MYYTLPNRAVIKICGPDGFKFLNNLSTNKIQIGQLRYSYFLNNQGRYLYDGFIYMQDEENIYLDISRDLAINFLHYIRSRQLRSNFKITELDNYNIVYSQSEFTHEDLIFVAHDPRSNLMGYRGIASGALGINDENLYQDNRFKYAIIEGCYDMVYEKSIPIEYNAEEQHALSFDKGCYVGQEVISRAKYQGVVRKKVFLLQNITGEVINEVVKGQQVNSVDGEKLGVVCSYWGSNVLALLNKDKFKEAGHKEKKAYIATYSVTW
ncbi:MAG: folate-binding protein YgfZ [Rickettsiaceae bacterium]|nr:folate-binding protein YgfZ [Rickettsiaceae bacterium]